MSVSKKIKHFLVEIFCFLPLLFLWYLGLGFAIIWIGVMFFSWFLMKINKPPMSLLYRKNPKYGQWDSYTVTQTKTYDVYDEDRYHIGTIETKGESETRWSREDREYISNYRYTLPYLFYFPLARILGIFISFVAIFTKKFYVSFDIPDDFDEADYSRKAYTFFNIIYKRTDKQKEIYLKKQKNKKETDQDKKEKKFIKALIATIIIIVVCIYGGSCIATCVSNL